MRVLLSIKPKYAERIFNGDKQYEFRRSIFRNPRVAIIVVYASFPVQRLIGELEIEDVLCAPPHSLWQRTKSAAGISQEDFFEYFAGKDKGYAIKLGKRRRYRRAMILKDRFGIAPPQSFVYVQ